MSDSGGSSHSLRRSTRARSAIVPYSDATAPSGVGHSRLTGRKRARNTHDAATDVAVLQRQVAQLRAELDGERRCKVRMAQLLKCKLGEWRSVKTANEALVAQMHRVRQLLRRHSASDASGAGPAVHRSRPLLARRASRPLPAHVVRAGLRAAETTPRYRPASVGHALTSNADLLRSLSQPNTTHHHSSSTMPLHEPLTFATTASSPHAFNYNELFDHDDDAAAHQQDQFFFANHSEPTTLPNDAHAVSELFALEESTSTATTSTRSSELADEATAVASTASPNNNADAVYDNRSGGRRNSTNDGDSNADNGNTNNYNVADVNNYNVADVNTRHLQSNATPTSPTTPYNQATSVHNIDALHHHARPPNPNLFTVNDASRHQIASATSSESHHYAFTSTTTSTATTTSLATTPTENDSHGAVASAVVAAALLDRQQAADTVHSPNNNNNNNNINNNNNNTSDVNNIDNNDNNNDHNHKNNNQNIVSRDNYCNNDANDFNLGANNHHQSAFARTPPPTNIHVNHDAALAGGATAITTTPSDLRFAFSDNVDVFAENLRQLLEEEERTPELTEERETWQATRDNLTKKDSLGNEWSNTWMNPPETWMSH